MNRRDFVVKGGGLLGLSLVRLDRLEGGPVPQPASTPREVFLLRITEIRAEFKRCFNAEDWAGLEKLYWEDAVLISKETNEVYQGRQNVVGYWRDFKVQKKDRQLTRITPKSARPVVQDVDLIRVVVTGEHAMYDMTAVDICAYEFNPDGVVKSSADRYLHKRTCTTAISEQSV